MAGAEERNETQFIARLVARDESAFKTIEAPSVVGELAFFDGRPRSATLDAVTDVEVRDGGNLADAHSAYFATPSFYRRIADELPAPGKAG